MKIAGYIDDAITESDKPAEKDNNPISIAFRDGPEDLSEEEAEYLKQQLNQFRELRKKFQHDDK